jgi:hypothetical protein
MTVRNTYKRELRLIEFGLLGSDPRLAAQLNVFCRLTADQGMPAWEQVPSRGDCIRKAAILIAMALAIAVAVIGLVISTYTKTVGRNVRCVLGGHVNDY